MSSSHHENVFHEDSDPDSDYETEGLPTVGSSSSRMVMDFMNIVFPHVLHQSPSKEKHTRTYINRNREKWHESMVEDYFSDKCTYTPKQFRRRFIMTRPLFLRIVHGVSAYDRIFFTAGPDAAVRQPLSNLQKCTATMRMLAFGVAADAVDEYTRCSETSAFTALNKFCDSVLAVFGPTYMRRANEEDIKQLVAINSGRGFPGMLDSIDCMHWEWKNCPLAWKGQYQGKSGVPTLVLEAVASHDTWIWHSFFGVSGKLNDLTIVARSPVFNDLMNGIAPPIEFEVNVHQYLMGYYLTDGIYPPWATFVKSIKNPTTHKESKFAQKQEVVRKDVKRAFGCLQIRFVIIRNPALAHSIPLLGKIMNTCICPHNMIVEDERHTYLNAKTYEVYVKEFNKDTLLEVEDDMFEEIRFTRRPSVINSIEEYMANKNQMHNRFTHYALQKDLMEHIYRKTF